jgi:hypothetical protein
MDQTIFFISFNESNQETNWARVLELHPDAIRLHGIKGIDKVHLACNDLCSTENFWTVDGDNWLLEELIWDVDMPADLLLFNALDPFSGLPTNLGGVKLWKKDSIINKDMSRGDFCLNATAKKMSLRKVFSRTDYNNTPYEAWKTAFRHCVKLLSPIFKARPNLNYADAYLEKWQSCGALDNGINNAQWAYRGYLDAVKYVEDTANDIHNINNYQWLKNYFDDQHN